MSQRQLQLRGLCPNLWGTVRDALRLRLPVPGPGCDGFRPQLGHLPEQRRHWKCQHNLWHGLHPAGQQSVCDLVH
jgi:hypothetical protein